MTAGGLSDLRAGDGLMGGQRSWTLVEPLRPAHGDEAALWLVHVANTPAERAVVKIGVLDRGERLVRRELVLRRDTLRSSPYVVEMLDANDSEQGSPAWFAMPLARGSLADVVADRLHRLADVLQYALHVTQGLTDAGVVHRDLNPSNVFFLDDGSGGIRAAIGDWSRAIVYGARQPATLEPVSIEYAAPQILHEDEGSDVRDDLYSIGAMLWAACTGVSPRGMGLGPERRLPVLGDIRTVPPQLSDLVGTLLQPNRLDRTPDIEGNRPALQWVHKQLEECLAEVRHAERAAGRSVVVGPATEASPSVQSPRRVATEHSRAERRSATPSVALLDPPPAPIPTAPSSRLRDARPPLSPERREPAPPTGVPASGVRQVERHADPAPLPRPRAARPGRGLTRAGVLGVFVVHVLAGVLILDPSSVLEGQLALVTSVAVAALVAGLDLVMAADLRRHGTLPPLGGLSLTKLAPVRTLLALAIALLTAQPLLLQLYQPEVNARREQEERIARTENMALRSALAAALARRQKLDTAYERRREALTRRIAAAADEGAEKSGAKAQKGKKREKAGAGGKGTTEADTGSSSASEAERETGPGGAPAEKGKGDGTKRTLIAERREARTAYLRNVSVSDREIDDARSALLSSDRTVDFGVSDGQALRRYLGDEPRALVIAGLVVFLLLVVEGVPSLLALVTRPRLTNR